MPPEDDGDLEDKSMGVARMQVDVRVLAMLLHLPDGTEIKSVGMAEDSRIVGAPKLCEITVSHAELVETGPVFRPPLVVPTFEQVERVERGVIMTSWGQRSALTEAPGAVE